MKKLNHFIFILLPRIFRNMFHMMSLRSSPRGRENTRINHLYSGNMGTTRSPRSSVDMKTHAKKRYLGAFSNFTGQHQKQKVK